MCWELWAASRFLDLTDPVELRMILSAFLHLKLHRPKKKKKKAFAELCPWFADDKFQFSSVQSLSRVWLFATPWTAAHQASLSITNSWSPPKPMSIVLVMPSSHLILCLPLLLLPSIFPSIRVFSNESALRIRWPKYWSFSFNISPSNEHPGLEWNTMTSLPTRKSGAWLNWWDKNMFTRVHETCV